MPTTNASAGLPRQDILAAMFEMALDFVPIATDIFVPLETPKKKGLLPVIPFEAGANLAPRTARGRGAKTNRVGWEFTDRAYSNVTRALAEPVTDEDQELFADYFDAQLVAANRVRNMLLRDMEKRIADFVHGSTYTGGGSTVTAAAAATWVTAASCDPLGDVNNAKAKIRAKCGRTPNLVQISFQNWLDLSRCTQFREAVKYTGRPDGVAPLQLIADFFGVKKVVVPGDQNLYNSAKEGQTASFSEIWAANKCFVAVVAEGMDPAAPCVGRTTYWPGGGGLMTADEFFDDDSETTNMRCKQCLGEVHNGTEFAFLITST